MKAYFVGVLVMTACGGGTDPDAFIGTWQFNAGAQRTSSCEEPVDLTGTQFFVHAGTASDLVIGPNECQLHLAVDGDTAAAPETICMMNGSSGMSCRTHVVTRRELAYTLELDGAMLIHEETWQQVDQDTCGTRVCNGRVTGTLIRVD